ncbi:MAG: cphA [Candidatus Saccharibacteria bacterium]|nr:cphA [Candidatus Saccharibacteria bacterium]
MQVSITTRAIIEAAVKRGWTANLIDESLDFFEVITDKNETYYFHNLTSYRGSGVNGFITKYKNLLYDLVKKNNLASLAPTEIFTDYNQANEFLKTNKKVVVKPHDQSHGNGITVNVTTEQGLHDAVELAQTFGSTTILQKHVEGDDYRLLFIGGELAAAAIREPAFVVGDGEHTLTELIGIENTKGDRGQGYELTKTLINTDVAYAYLKESVAIVPGMGEKVQVVGTANIGQGGVSIDVTDTVSPNIAQEAKRLVEYLRLDVAGVDYIIDESGTGYLIEINTAPSFGLHEYPHYGDSRHVADTYLDWVTS